MLKAEDLKAEGTVMVKTMMMKMACQEEDKECNATSNKIAAEKARLCIFFTNLLKS